MDDAAFQKNDSQKVRWSLIPWDALLGILHVMEFGAQKYAPDNWAKGADWSRYFNAMQRHLIAWWMGEKADPETGRSHLHHAGCCLLFLIAYELRGIGRDDRPSMPPEKVSEPEVPSATPAAIAQGISHGQQRMAAAIREMSPADRVLAAHQETWGRSWRD